jgi:AraC-like DNA-binding protein
MDYRETRPPDRLLPLIKLGWTLSVPDDGPQWFVHNATPDGCMEIIRRLGGRSQWNGEQPDCFVAGMLTGPAELLLGTGSSFVGVRLWPWAWRLISGRSPGSLTDSWAPLQTAAPGFEMPASIEAAFRALAPFRASSTMIDVAEALPSARTPAELGAAVGLPPRALQRWFERNVGQPARSYLRMVRFGEAFAELPSTGDGLAGHAAGHGFADQAHMAREFRSLAGAPPGTARKHGHGPFIDPNIDRS